MQNLVIQHSELWEEFIDIQTCMQAYIHYTYKIHTNVILLLLLLYFLIINFKVEDIISWLHSSRLPLFLGSDLFYEYKLCSALNDRNPGTNVVRDYYLSKPMVLATKSPSNF